MKNQNKNLKNQAKKAYKFLNEAIEWYGAAKTDNRRREAAYEIEAHLQTLNLARNALVAAR